MFSEPLLDVVNMFVQMYLKGTFGPAHILQSTRALQQVDYPYSGASDKGLYFECPRGTTGSKPSRSPSSASVKGTNLTFSTLIIARKISEKNGFSSGGIENISDQLISQGGSTPKYYLRFSWQKGI